MAPLDWGLGHATRCIPLVKALLHQGYEVVIATEGAQEQLLKKEFPHLLYLPLTGYRVRYSKHKGWLPFKILQQLPRLWRTVEAEHRWLESIIEQYGIQLVISDNRYGLYSHHIPSIFITHQLCIKAPFRWLENLVQQCSYRYINRFTACWVPDEAGDNGLAGTLSHPRSMPSVPVSYMGIMARLAVQTVAKKYRVGVLLSGPEPQRSLLEEQLLKQLPQIAGQHLLIRGLPESTALPDMPDRITCYNHLGTVAMSQALQECDWIVCRSGYTSVMELMTLQLKTVLVPTPEQTEQEYLASYLMQKGYAYSRLQHGFDLVDALEAAATFQYHFPVITPFDAAKLQQLLAGLDTTIFDKHNIRISKKQGNGSH